MPAGEGGPAARILVVDRSGELAARIRHHATEPVAVVKACPDVTRAEARLASGPWDVVVAGPSLMHRAGLRRLASLHARHPWVSVVLALHERPRADLAEIVGVGACDLVPLHADDAELTRALARAARITRRRLGIRADGPGAAPRGRTVMISSASGGCGKTFLATNAAEFLARTTGQPVVLVDLDLQFGEVSTALRLRRELTIVDALAAEAEGHDLDEILDDYLLAHPDGFRVLPAPRLPAEADAVTPGDVTRLLDVLRSRGAWVVIDTHEGLGDVLAAALDVTDHVFVVATPDRPSLVNLGRYLAVLRRLGMADRNVSVVLNKAEPDTGFDPAALAAEFGRGFAAVVPYSRDVPRSINSGVPVIAGHPKSVIAARLAGAFGAALPRPPEVEPEPEPVPAPIVRVVPVPVVPAAPDPGPPVAAEPPPPAEPEPVPVEVVIDLRAPVPVALPGWERSGRTVTIRPRHRYPHRGPPRNRAEVAGASATRPPPASRLRGIDPLVPRTSPTRPPK